MTDVCLVSMPFVALERPSLALGLLQSSANKIGIPARSEYPAFEFAELIGAEFYSRLLHCAPDQNIGDWLFAGVAFPDQRERHCAFVEVLDQELVASWLWLSPETLESELWRARSCAEALVGRLARQIANSGARIVGCSSVFEQHVASLALLRAVKACDPSIQTMLGGANCEAEMGEATHRSFEWVDYVVSGEADLFFGELCRDILHAQVSNMELTQLPVGTLGPIHRLGSDCATQGPLARARVNNLDEAPIPDFSDYFAALSQSKLRDEIYPALLVETSRGCWWGEKHHCTFCGLNGSEMTYRPKSGPRVLHEFKTLVDTYGTNRLLVVDNILHRQHLTTVIPALIDAGAPYSIFYETKANLTHEQLGSLSRAGVRRVQPGFESMHLGALKLFDKGTTPAINLQYLKSARTFATFVTWNFLWQIPGEDWSWYADVADWVPLVTHLQAPNTLCAVRFDRFSLYHERPDDYGLKLKPTSGLGNIYPVDEGTLNDIAYYFTDFSRPLELTLRRLDDGIKRLDAELGQWMCLWQRVRRADPDAPEVPVLEILRLGDGVEIIDTRPVAPAASIELKGLDARVLINCGDAPTRIRLASSLADDGAKPADGVLERTILRLIERRLLLELDGRLIALPTAKQQQPYLAVDQYPGGYFCIEQRAHLAPHAKT